MKLKKFLFIVIINLIVLFFIVELCSYIFLCNKYKDDIINYLKITTGKDIKIPYIPYVKVSTQDRNSLLSNFRPVEYRNPDKKPIILFGCSYIYGFGLDENQTFSKKLADYTGRTVINRGRFGTGLPFLYYQLSDNMVINELPKNPEYIIYTLIPDHFPRLFRYRTWVMSGEQALRYKIKNNNLIEDKSVFPLLHSFFTSIVIEEYISIKNTHNREKTNKLFVKLLSESNKLIKEKFSSSVSEHPKFVIIYFECPLDLPDLYQNEINSIQNISSDIIFFNVLEEVPEIKDRKYWLEDECHPNAQAWDRIVPILVEKLHLND